MNKNKRGRLLNAVNLLNTAASIVRDVRSEEEFTLSNIPENLQESYRYEKSEDAVSEMEDAVDLIREAVESVKNAMQ